MPSSSRSERAGDPRPARVAGCPVCGRAASRAFLDLEHVPVNTTRLYPTAHEARGERRADVRLGLCDGCGLIRNIDFDPSLVRYDERYENTLDFSQTFRDYRRDLARRLVSTYDLHGKDVVEIGPGSGEFLRALCEEGGNRGVGFDPSLREPRRLDERVQIVPRPYGERERDVPVDFICFRHVLEHVDDPRRFLDGIHTAVGDREHVVLYVEVPDAALMLAGVGVWDVIYQHCSYFTEASLHRALGASGFPPQRVGTAFGGQYLFAETEIGRESEVTAPSRSERDEMTAVCERFADGCRARIRTWDGRLRELFDAGASATGWGAGAKGVTFLNLVPAAERIPAIVDINPRKQGNFVPGTAQPIVPPERLLRLLPDTVLIMNPNYRNEVEAELASMGLRPTVELVA